jgi:hypothetical protein
MNMLTYFVILAIAFSGLIHASWWSVAIGALLLGATLISEDTPAFRLLATSQANYAAVFAGISKVSLGIAAAITAFLLGEASAWMFSL